MARPRSMEQDRGVSVWLPSALRVMRDAVGSLRYFSLSGFCSSRKSTIRYPPKGKNHRVMSQLRRAERDARQVGLEEKEFGVFVVAQDDFGEVGIGINDEIG